MLLTLSACQSNPEKKMLHALKTEQFGVTVKLLKIAVSDTLYEKEAVTMMDYDSDVMDSIDLVIKARNIRRDSKFRHRMAVVQHRKDSASFYTFVKIQELESRIDFSRERALRMQSLKFSGKDSDIAIYDVLVTTMTDTVEFYVSKDFKVLGPKFMFTDENFKRIPSARHSK
jgi:hypothetical protein